MFSAVILAGGFATRIRGLVPDVPKSMLRFGSFPFLSYLVSFLSRSGCTEVVIAAGYRPETIFQEFSKPFWIARNVRVVVEPEPLGTGGAVRYVSEDVANPEIFLCNGDTVLECDPLVLREEFHRSGFGGVCVFTRNKGVPNEGAILVHGRRVLSFQENIPAQRVEPIPRGAFRVSSTGTYFFKRDTVLSRFPQGKSSLESEVIPSLVRVGELGALSNGNRFFLDFGVPARYAQLRENEGLLRRIYGEPFSPEE